MKNRLKKEKIDSNTRKESKTFLENKWVAIGLIILISAVIYYNSLNVPFILDDISKIVQNPDIKKLSNIKTKLIYPYNKEYYNYVRNDPSRPLTYLTFTLNYYFGKLNTFTYHLFNMLMHAFNAVLIFLLTRKIIFYTHKKVSHFFPLFTALFFAIHPINTSTVTYIFSRSDILATFFYILSLLFFIKTFETSKKLYIFSILCFVLSLFSKQISVTLPAIVLVFDYIFLSDFKIAKVKSKKYYHIFFWAVLFFYLLSRYLYFGGLGDLEAKFTCNRYDYFVIQPYIILRYLKLLIIPTGLCLYCTIEPAGISGFKILASFFLIIGIFIMVYKIYRRKTGISKIVLFCTLWFFITLSPTSSFFPTATPLVENRLYLSGLGFYLAIVFIYFLIFHKDVSRDRPSSWVLFGLIGIHIFLLGMATVKRNQVYHNPVLLWQDVVSKYSKDFKAHTYLALLYYEQKEYTKAIQEYQKAIEKNPNHPDAYNNLGIIYNEQKKYAKAIKEFKKALEIKPDHAEAHYNLGLLYKEQKEYAKAIQEYQKALKINPDYADVHNNLGIVYKNQKEYAKAIQEYQKVLKINPSYAEAHNNLGLLYYEQKDYAKAIQEYQKAIKINPDYADAHNNLGVLYYYQKDYGKALQELEYLLKLNPDNENIRAKIRMVKELLNEHSNMKEE